MFDFCHFSIWRKNRDDVKSCINIIIMMSNEVVVSNFRDLLLFAIINGGSRISKIGACSRFHLNKYKDVSISCNKVYFTILTSVICCDELVAFFFRYLAACFSPFWPRICRRLGIVNHTIEATTVDWTRAVLFQSQPVFFRWIAFVFVKVVFRIFIMHGYHEMITLHFCDDRGCSY